VHNTAASHNSTSSSISGGDMSGKNSHQDFINISQFEIERNEELNEIEISDFTKNIP
jgi:hypothetical protein